MRISIDTEKFWLWITRFAFKRLTRGLYTFDGVPDGVPTIRDSEARCLGYEPRKRRIGDWGCDSDGHYLCRECCHLNIEEEV